jgi:hypothetical protein
MRILGGSLLAQDNIKNLLMDEEKQMDDSMRGTIAFGVLSIVKLFKRH